MSKPVFLNHEIVFNPTGNEFDKARDQLLGTYKLVKIEDWEYKFIKQPKLSIPKKIAEELEQVAVTNWEIWEFFIYAEEFSTELKNWLNHGKDDNANSKIAIAYLAGKTLGVELVEVEG